MLPEQKKITLQQKLLNEIKGQPNQRKLTVMPAKNLEKDMQLKAGTKMLLKPAHQQDNINPALLKKKRQKKRRLGL